MRKTIPVLAIFLVVLSLVLFGCKAADKVPGVTATGSVTMVPPATALATIMPTALATPAIR